MRLKSLAQYSAALPVAPHTWGLAVETELRFATVEIHTTPWEAHISRALLESEGIPAFLAGEHHVSAMWPMSHALGGVRLKIPAERMEQAFEVLAQRNSGELEAALLEQMPFTSLACRACGSTALRDVRPWPSVVLSLCFFFVGSAIFPPLKEKQCGACGRPADAEP